MANEAIVSLDVAHQSAPLTGIVRACSDDFLWVERIDDARRLDGRCVLPWAALHGAAVEPRAEAFRALLAGQTSVLACPIPSSWDELIHTLVESRTHVAIHDSNPDNFWVGTPRRASMGTFLLDEVLADGSPRFGREVAVSEILCLIVGSRYLDAVGILEQTWDERARVTPPQSATLPNEIVTLLRGAQRDGALVHLVPEGEPGWWSGVVVGLSEAIVVLRQLDEERLEFDGHVAFRLDCLACASLDRKNIARWRVLERRGQTAPILDVVPADLVALMQAFVGHRSLVSLQDDDPSACFIGYLSACNPQGSVRMQFITTDGDDDGDYDLPTKSVTIVEWDSAYLVALEALERLRCS